MGEVTCDGNCDGGQLHACAPCRAKWLQRDHDQMLANLTAVQNRCTELLEENRRLKAAANAKATTPDFDYRHLSKT